MPRKKAFLLYSAEDKPRLWEVKCPICLKLYGKTIRTYSKREIELNKGTIHGGYFIHICSDCRCKYDWGAKVDHAEYAALQFYDLQTGKLKKDFMKKYIWKWLLPISIIVIIFYSLLLLKN